MKFVDLDAQFRSLETDIRSAIDAVLEHGQYIMGPEVAAFEEELGEFCGVEHVIGCSSGTDALLMALMSYGVGPGDAIIAPPFTFVATAEVIQLLGATTVFVDVEEDTFNIDVAQLEETVQRVKSQGKLNLKGIIPVDLFGLSADYESIDRIAKEHDLFVLADSAQSFGGSYHEKRIGSFGDVCATSFFPAKPLGCYGDGGAVFTNNGDIADILRSIRFHGKGTNQYDNVRTGITGRLDTIQAAILRCKLKVLEQEIDARQAVADRYSAALADVVKTPKIPPNNQSAWAQYTVRSSQRDQIRQQLQEAGVPTAVYYPCPLHMQPAFSEADGAGVSMPVSEMLSKEVFSLPMHPYLSHEDQDRIIELIKDSVSA
ncbi:MAG: DegT/DnrJ/EryC1/StrS family aminotransferase [Acidiferrobacterales bacterium]|nr:DegT/DnrJ/EryC1/StrS family aminotransferase [Acidiferrobacterales bacterium]